MDNKTVEPHLDQHNVTKKTIFAPFFTVDEEFENDKDEADETITVTKPISYCYHIWVFLTYIKED